MGITRSDRGYYNIHTHVYKSSFSSIPAGRNGADGCAGHHGELHTNWSVWSGAQDVPTHVHHTDRPAYNCPGGESYVVLVLLV